jgi:hypothetical protein
MKGKSMSTVRVLVAWLTARATEADRNDRGSAELTTMIALSFVGVVAVVLIVTALQALGLNVVEEVGNRIGI